MSNILNELSFSKEEIAKSVLHRSEKINVLAIGLTKNQVLAKHKTKIPTTLITIHGSVEFKMDGESTIIRTHDTFQIPVEIEHEVRGLDEKNAFILIQEK